MHRTEQEGFHQVESFADRVTREAKRSIEVEGMFHELTEIISSIPELAASDKQAAAEAKERHAKLGRYGQKPRQQYTGDPEDEIKFHGDYILPSGEQLYATITTELEDVTPKRKQLSDIGAGSSSPKDEHRKLDQVLVVLIPQGSYATTSLKIRLWETTRRHYAPGVPSWHKSHITSGADLDYRDKEVDSGKWRDLPQNEQDRLEIQEAKTFMAKLKDLQSPSQPQ